MNITYINHSGFLVETADCYYLFDYFKGSLPALKADKPILVFASHNHHDHYNSEIFNILRELGMTQITAILAKDIPAKKYPKGIECLKVTFHQTYELPHNSTLQTLHSTDAGVAFLLKTPEGTIYHAGDLNDWVWEGETEKYNKQMTGMYRHEIDILKDLCANKSIDIAFIPLDPRQEKDYANGMLYFMKKIHVSKVYPMHYWEKPEVISRFLQDYPEYENIIVFTEDIGTENM